MRVGRWGLLFATVLCVPLLQAAKSSRSILINLDICDENVKKKSDVGAAGRRERICCKLQVQQRDSLSGNKIPSSRRKGRI